MPTVTFAPAGLIIDVETGSNLLDVARKAGYKIESPCNSVGTCGKCKIRIEGNINTNEAKHHLTETEKAGGWVLACQADINSNITVFLKNKEEAQLKILSEGQSFNTTVAPDISKHYDESQEITVVSANDILIGYEQGDTIKDLYGVVIDIGTTTLVAALIDLHTGQELTSQSSLNPQSKHAQDVLSRISLASTDEGRQLLYRLIIDEINSLILQIADRQQISVSSIYEVVFSGNTCMLHLATNTDSSSLGKYPYLSQIAGGEYRQAAEHGLNISPFGLIYLPPIISGFVGADITSGILASQLHKEEGIALFVDIGTNGEMALAVNGKLSATSTAAGPAFEGMNITHGIRAGNGAIDTFLINGDGNVEITTIGNVAATGICGSGLLDIVGELVANGGITPPGRFTNNHDDIATEVSKRISTQDGKTIFYLTDKIWLSQKDIRQVQLAKGAIRAGIEALLEQVQISANDVDRVLIAGSFGYHLRARSLFQLGLLPIEFEGKVDFVGNTSKTGGIAFLINKKNRNEIQQLVKEIKSIELADDPDFEKKFVQCLGFSEGYRSNFNDVIVYVK